MGNIPEVVECSANWLAEEIAMFGGGCTKCLLFRRKRFHSDHRGKFNTERCTRYPRVGLFPPRSLRPSRRAQHPFALVLVSVSTSGFGPALASTDAVLGMFEPTWRVRKEGMCRMPEGLAGLRTHRNTVEVLSRQSRFKATVVCQPFNRYQSIERKACIIWRIS